jgi:hypothetical protein
MQSHNRSAASTGGPSTMPALAIRVAHLRGLLDAAELIEEALLGGATVESLAAVVDDEGGVTVASRTALARDFAEVALIAESLRRTPPRGRLALLVLGGGETSFGHVLPPESRSRSNAGAVVP